MWFQPKSSFGSFMSGREVSNNWLIEDFVTAPSLALSIQQNGFLNITLQKLPFPSFLLLQTIFQSNYKLSSTFYSSLSEDVTFCSRHGQSMCSIYDLAVSSCYFITPIYCRSSNQFFGIQNIFPYLKTL